MQTSCEKRRLADGCMLVLRYVMLCATLFLGVNGLQCRSDSRDAVGDEESADG